MERDGTDDGRSLKPSADRASVMHGFVLAGTFRPLDGPLCAGGASAFLVPGPAAWSGNGTGSKSISGGTAVHRDGICCSVSLPPLGSLIVVFPFVSGSQPSGGVAVGIDRMAEFQRRGTEDKVSEGRGGHERQADV